MQLGKSFLFGGIFVGIMGTLISGNVSKSASEKLTASKEISALQKNILQADEDRLAILIDSLLSLDKISPDIASALHLKSAEVQMKGELSAEFPADRFYGSWDTKFTHPYPEELSENDTTLTLLLTNSLMKKHFVVPFDSYITSSYGWRDGKMHNGVDIALLVGDTVRAAFDGVVRLAKWQGGYGRAIVIRHDNGLETIYGHLYRWLVKSGDRVTAGQPIAKGGNSGASRGSHLHLETRFKGKPINPACFIDFENHELKNDTLVLKKTRYGYIGHQPGGAFHKVRRGDFLYKIAQEYSTTVKQICAMNGFTRNHFLIVGEEIKVAE